MAWRVEPTAEMPVVRIDLSEAYASLRRRGKALRRRRLISSTVAVVVLAGLFTVVGFYYASAIPLPDGLSLPATTTIYYSDGTTIMARLGAQNRVNVEMAQLPEYVPAAVVAAVDPEFWDDSGSRISRQYARAATGLAGTSYPDRARALILAWKLEDTYTKQEILGFYLNTVYFGRNAYGIGAAAQAYFGKRATELTLSEAIVLAGVLESPGGTYDPTVNATRARQRFAAIVDQLRADAAISADVAASTTLPRVNTFDREGLGSGLDRPTGLIVAHVLAELRAQAPFTGRPADFIENGGYSIVTTVDPRAQRALEETVDETVPGSVMNGQPRNLQAAGVAVEPGTGRVLAYYGGHEGTGADYAGWYYNANGVAAGYGAHPPGQTAEVYVLAAALADGYSVRSHWPAPPTKEFPASGHGPDNPVRDLGTARCQPVCTLAEAAVAGLNVPYYAATEKLGAAKVIDVARKAGVTALWVPETASTDRRRVDLIGKDGTDVSPDPFGSDIGLGTYPMTVLDQAGAMAAFANGGVYRTTHFVDSVRQGDSLVYSPAATSTRVLTDAQAADLTWALSANPAGHLDGGRPSAAQAGSAPLRGSAVETAHAWIVGYTSSVATAIWVGNRDIELPLRDTSGARITGSGLPAGIYRAFMDSTHDRLGLTAKPFAKPTYAGREGDAG